MFISEIKSGLKFEPSLSGNLRDYDPWEGRYEYSSLTSFYRSGYSYDIYLPEKLKSWETYHVTGSIKDKFGRPLSIDIKFKTDHRRPHIYFKYKRAVLEQSLANHNDVPLYLTNIHEYEIKYRTLTDKAGEDKTKIFKPKFIEDVAYAHPLGIPQLLNKKSGIVTGELTEYKGLNESESVDWLHFMAQLKYHVSALAKWGTITLSFGSPICGQAFLLKELKFYCIKMTTRV